MTAIGAFFKARYGVGVLKGNASAQQLLREEIDALGICMKCRQVTKVAVDIAFHERGLNYGNGDETPARIVKKLLRTAIVLKYVLDAGPGSKVLFATPKANPAVGNRLLEAEAEVRLFADQQGWDYKTTRKARTNLTFRVSLSALCGPKPPETRTTRTRGKAAHVRTASVPITRRAVPGVHTRAGRGEVIGGGLELEILRRPVVVGRRRGR
jgi:hypothetical protein